MKPIDAWAVFIGDRIFRNQWGEAFLFNSKLSAEMFIRDARLPRDPRAVRVEVRIKEEK